MTRTFNNRIYIISHSDCNSIDFDIEFKKRALKGKYTFSCYLFEQSEIVAFKREGFLVTPLYKNTAFPKYCTISWNLAIVTKTKNKPPLSLAQQFWLNTHCSLCKKIG